MLQKLAARTKVSAHHPDLMGILISLVVERYQR
eukprot:COSAG06_NODE_31784_length_515_cov_5.951923_1_plen_32_part_10